MKDISVFPRFFATALVACLVSLNASANPGSFNEDWQVIQSRMSQASASAAQTAREFAAQTKSSAAKVIVTVTDKVKPVVHTYDVQTPGIKIAAGAAVGGVAAFWANATRGAKTIVWRFVNKSAVVLAATGVVVIVDGAAQALFKSDGSYLFNVVERLVNLIADPTPVAAGTVSGYYASDDGFSQYLQVDAASASHFASLEPKLASKVQALADFIRSTEAAGGIVQVAIVQ